MDTISYPRRKPGPRPKTGPKATSTPMSLYPIHRGAIRWWMERNGSESESAALRQMIDRAMSLELGGTWELTIEEPV